MTIDRHCKALNKARWWLVPKARFLFDVAVAKARDDEFGGGCYSIDLDGAVCNGDKIFWVQCESVGRPRCRDGHGGQGGQSMMAALQRDKRVDHGTGMVQAHEPGARALLQEKTNYLYVTRTSTAGSAYAGRLRS